MHYWLLLGCVENVVLQHCDLAVDSANFTLEVLRILLDVLSGRVLRFTGSEIRRVGYLSEI